MTRITQPNSVLLQQEPEVPLPSKFSGSRKDSASDFKREFTRLFVLQPNRFPSDAIKILYISSFLTRSAKIWYQTLEEKESPALENLDVFWTTFMDRFEIVLAIDERQFKINHCKQGRNEAIEEFNERYGALAMKLNYNDEALIGIYVNAISPDILEKLQYYEKIPATLEATMAACEVIDSRRRQVQQRRQMDFTSANVNTANVRTDSKPNSNASSQSTESRGPLTDEEKQRRRSLGLCLYCGESGHLVANCPKSSSSKNPSARK